MPTGRPAKNRVSIVEKLLRQKTMHLSQMQDIAGCRIVVHGILEQDQVVERLVAALSRVKVADRRKRPSHSYRAVHVIATAQNKSVEIQVRTRLQDLWAQSSEVLADRIDPRIKYGGGAPEIQHVLSLYAGYIADFESVEAGLTKPESWPGKASREPAERKVELVQSLRELIDMFEAIPRKVH